MAKPLSELTKNFSDERKARIEKGGALLLMEYDLVSKLRQDRELTQKELAGILEVRQSAVSKLEHQEDVLIQTLARYVRALGGELEIRAKFPDREVTLRQFTGHEKEPRAAVEGQARGSALVENVRVHRIRE